MWKVVSIVIYESDNKSIHFSLMQQKGAAVNNKSTMKQSSSSLFL